MADNCVKTDDPDQKKRGIRRILQLHYERNSSCQSLPWVVDTKSKTTRIIWLLIFAISLACMIYHVYLLFDDFLAFGKHINVVWTSAALPFPAITICNLNAIRKSQTTLGSPELQNILSKYNPVDVIKKIKNYSNYSDNAQSEYFNIMDYLGEAVSGKHYDFSDPTSHADDLQWAFLSAYNAQSAETRRAMGHQLEDMMISATLADQKISKTNFTHSLSTFYGNCYTLDNVNLVSSNSGPFSGLELIINIEIAEYIPGLSNSYGIQLVIHEPNTPPFPVDDGVGISAGTHTLMSLRQNHFSRLDSPYKPSCSVEWPYKLAKDVKYSRHACNKVCISTQIRQDCGCYDDVDTEMNTLLGDTHLYPPCRSEAQQKCVGNLWNVFAWDSCLCKAPCNEVTFSQSVSYIKWPDLILAKLVAETICKEKPDKCQNYRSLDDRKVHQEFLKLAVYYETLNYDELEETPNMGFAVFVAGLGGAIGLWTGLSVLGIFELLHFLLDVLYHVFKGFD